MVRAKLSALRRPCVAVRCTPRRFARRGLCTGAKRRVHIRSIAKPAQRVHDNRAGLSDHHAVPILRIDVEALHSPPRRGSSDGRCMGATSGIGKCIGASRSSRIARDETNLFGAGALWRVVASLFTGVAFSHLSGVLRPCGANGP